MNIQASDYLRLLNVSELRSKTESSITLPKNWRLGFRVSGISKKSLHSLYTKNPTKP